MSNNLKVGINASSRGSQALESDSKFSGNALNIFLSQKQGTRQKGLVFSLQNVAKT